MRSRKRLFVRKYWAKKDCSFLPLLLTEWCTWMLFFLIDIAYELCNLWDNWDSFLSGSRLIHIPLSKNTVACVRKLGLATWHLIVKSQQWKHQNNMWNLLKVLKVNNKNTRFTSMTSSVVFINNFEQISHISLVFPQFKEVNPGLVRSFLKIRPLKQKS